MHRLVFDEVAELYDRARPAYPDRLVDDVIEITGTDPRSRVLEVGAGTGQATLSFARRGLSLLALEPGPRLAAVARAKLAGFPHVCLLESSFESWSLEHAAFDLVISAQALHWVDPEVRLVKAHSALKPGGWLAIFANIPQRGRSALDQTIDACYEKVAPSHRSAGAEKRARLEPQLAECGLFRVLPARQYHWAASYTADQYADLLRTYSDHHLLPDEERTALLAGISDAIASHGGTLGIEYEARLLLGRRSTRGAE